MSHDHVNFNVTFAQMLLSQVALHLAKLKCVSAGHIIIVHTVVNIMFIKVI